MTTSAPWFDWEALLLSISERRVIPVVGRELLVLELDGEEIPLESYLARRLATSLGVEGDGHQSLNQVALAYLGRNGQRIKIYPRLKAILEEHPLPIPRPLRKLAEITDFNLFVSTSPDSLLFRAVELARAGSEPPPVCLAYAPHSKVEDLPPKLSDRETHVYQLFGKVDVLANYAVTEEDTLEILHSLQSDRERPSILFDELKASDLLLLGCGFPDWLTRFFLRTVANKRLLPPRQDSQFFVVDRRGQEDRELIVFLQYLETELFPSGDPVSFIDELHQRWLERTSGRETRKVAAEMEPGAIFLSYAHEDQAAVEAMAKELEAAGLDVWFDRKKLQPGDDWKQRVRDNIHRCSLFFPFLSRKAQQRREGEFRFEWNLASERAKRFYGSPYPFIQPILVDDIPHGAPGIPDHFWGIQGQRFPSGQPTADFIARTRETIRALRSGMSGRTGPW